MIWIPLISALAGGLIAIAGSWIVEYWRQCRRAKSLALALRGEINAIIEIVRIRGYVEMLEATIAEATQTPSPMHVTWYIQTKNRYFIAYEENASDLGMLSPGVAEEIARTYALARSFLDDVTNPNWLDRQTPEDVINAMQEAEKVLVMAIDSGTKAISKIEAKYIKRPCPWWRSAYLRIFKVSRD